MLATENLTIRFGGHAAVDGVSCAFRPGTLTAIVGPNGAGKTTYFNLISGQLRATAGTVLLDGQDISRAGVAERTHRGIGRAFQLTNLFPNLTVRENVRLVAQAKARRGFDVLSMADTHAELIARADAVLEQVRLIDVADRNRTLEELGAYHGASFNLTGRGEPEQLCGSNGFPLDRDERV